MRIGETNINARGLSRTEIQESIDFAAKTKDKPVQQFLEDQQTAFLRLTELVPDFAKEMLEVIKKHHPSLLKKI